ncbi:hypothetical protein [Bacteriovorax sp. Seq25_V]|uniref:hypothetical protein n=1 Tax=Bacteriovorax sp. Seq25_V TaxID=1201288 RepID=UPI00038A524F|nr:hypothetical protein [Bacteriovorax sp. Seq25_V]EQC43504.1 hypothetical protein M900_0112 [Bacteriovorax sp. Seq25_V]
MLRNLTLGLTLFFTSNIFAGGFCLSHGQCQSLTDETTACYLVSTGKNQCEERCFTIYAGSYCDFIPGKNYGTCKDENHKQAIVDKNDCSKAIPQEIVQDLL